MYSSIVIGLNVDFFNVRVYKLGHYFVRSKETKGVMSTKVSNQMVQLREGQETVTMVTAEVLSLFLLLASSKAGHLTHR